MDTPEHSIEIIARDAVELCYIVRADYEPVKTTFVTQPDFKQQVGFINREPVTSLDLSLAISSSRSRAGMVSRCMQTSFSWK